ncbi:hypothetical protein KY290_012932 [Solanum tuberosum]|uniref:Uncharacterized protein n=1 Tax=Solanum tuberosum TaxID=4113 RepID=A0ABQ7VK90_SOLTU|nr:hypothetical protein KY285_012701 [Solanum tuberosum]KAH0768951.1 hypothetical protein KY290_012932 [Solanum tuberosum]
MDVLPIDIDNIIVQRIQETPPRSVGQLRIGPPALVHISGQMHVHEQQTIKDRLAKVERQQQKKEHKKKSKFLMKMMDTLRRFCGTDDEDDSLSGPDSSNSN